MGRDLLRILMKLLEYLAWQWLRENVERLIVPRLRPWAEKLLSKQEQADLARHPDRFSSFKQLTDLEARIKGRGNDPRIAEMVRRAFSAYALPQYADTPTTDQLSPYEQKKAGEDAWES